MRVEARYVEAAEAFAELADGRAFVAPPDAGAIESFVTSNKTAIARFARLMVVLDQSSPEFVAIRKQIADANADADLLADPSPTGLAAALTELAEATESLSMFASDEVDQREPTALLVSARSLLGTRSLPTPLPVGGAGELRAEARRALAVIASWRAAAIDCTTAINDWAALEPVDMPEPDRNSLDEARLSLRQAIELLTVDSALSVAVVARAARHVAAADRRLARLRAIHSTARLHDLTGPDEASFSALAGEVASGGVDHAGSIPELVGSHLDLDEAAPSSLVVIVEVFVLAVTAILGALIAARVLYVDKAFGTTGDYMAMLAAGVGSELLASTLLGTLTAWRAPATFPRSS